MKLTRRQFIVRSSAGIATLGAASVLGFDLPAVADELGGVRTVTSIPTPTVCPYCASGCGLMVYSERNAAGEFVKLLSVEGDPDNPINQGCACAKGSAMFNLREIYDPVTGEQQINPMRIKKPLYRAPGSSKWEEKDWEWMTAEIAKRVKASRDKSFIEKENVVAKVKNVDGTETETKVEVTVNRTEKIASIGGSGLDNEECYLHSKLMRALGVVYLETQARLCHASTVGGLAPTFGRGIMTNHMIDMKNTDCALIMGSNAAENHPISMKWLTKARQERGAKIIHVDPRFTRTSQNADIYCPLRSGTDIAFLGGMIKYILDNNLWHHDYVVPYTNASFLVDDSYSFDAGSGHFSGFNEAGNKYDYTSWNYKTNAAGEYLKDPTLQDPRSVFQLMKKHYERYDVDTVCAVTGTPKDVYLEVLKTFCATGAPNKTGTILYAMGITQHSVGSQNIRAFAMIQLLLGNMGRAGGGINALRGENNVQGATDMALLYHYIPGYISSPTNSTGNKDLLSFLKAVTPGAKNVPAATLPEFNAAAAAGIAHSGWRVNTNKWVVSMLKAWWGNTAKADNDYAFHYLPKRDEKKNYSHMAIFENLMSDKTEERIEGLFVMGTNPVVGGPSVNREQRALANLKWMVSCDLWLNETAEFWTPDGQARSVGSNQFEKLTPDKIQTEVFFLPAAAVYEKEGTAASTGRWTQYRWKGADPVGESKADLDIIYELGKKIKAEYAASKAPKDEPINYMTWDYGPHEPDIMKVALELNGYNTADGKPVEGFAKLAADGSTACGNWVYCGIMTVNQDGSLKYKAKSRDNVDNSKEGLGIFKDWSWAWPMNRRIAYNRCSVQADGVSPWPGDAKRQLVRWNPLAKDPKDPTITGLWEGDDVPDFIKTNAPTSPTGTMPFIMHPDMVGGLYVTNGTMKEGPFPEHYEPWETPTQNKINRLSFNPMAKVFDKNQSTPDKYPIVATTYRLVEHWQTGALTRNLPWLAELMPNMFVELSEELAKEKGIENGNKVIVSSSRGDIEAIACVTKRFKPFNINGKKVHEMGLVWQFGFKGYAKGDPANRLSPHVGDANVFIPEYKAWLCDIRRA
ncbi:MAG: formate dehydrogenase-N subunit alpha [Firmicutes bacterium]|nr:formate dehydrogenase-N subunit alpha [Bacillota bacterium]